MKLERALLEEWMRKYYFEVDYDIGSSGVEDYSMAEVRAMLGIRHEDVDAVVFHDSQTLGGATARQALANRSAGGDAERVMITHGSTEANFLVMTALLSAGDEVIVLDPFYQQLYAIALGVGCELRRWQLRFEQGFRPDFDELRALLTPRTKMIVVNFPHNPTGVTLSRGEQQELIAAAAGVGAYLVWDGAFADLTYETPPLPDPTAEYERAISMGTMSKAFGLPGLRVGWCVAAPEVLAIFAHLRDYTLLHLSPLVELIAGRVFENAELLVGRRREQARGSRQIVATWVEANADLVEWVPPMGGVCCFPRLRPEIDVEEFCRRLAEEHRVLLVPGICFKAPRHVRLGFGGSRSGLEQGLERFAKVLRGEVEAL